MGRIKINCCLNCEDRHVGCHGTCERYKRERAEIEAAKAAASAQSRAAGSICANANGNKKARRVFSPGFLYYMASICLTQAACSTYFLCETFQASSMSAGGV